MTYRLNITWCFQQPICLYGISGNGRLVRNIHTYRLTRHRNKLQDGRVVNYWTNNTYRLQAFPNVDSAGVSFTKRTFSNGVLRFNFMKDEFSVSRSCRCEQLNYRIRITGWVILETQAQRRTRFLRSVITFDTHRQFFTTWRTPPHPQLTPIQQSSRFSPE